MPASLRRAAVLVPAVAAIALGGVATRASAAGVPLLPDLDQEAPGQLEVAPTVAHGHRRWWLGFSSAVSNVGTGPLSIEGHRADRSTPTMVADQVVASSGSTPQTI